MHGPAGWGRAAACGEPEAPERLPEQAGTTTPTHEDEEPTVPHHHSPWPPRPAWYDDPSGRSFDEPGGGDRSRHGTLTHLTFLDGRLVDTWTEPAEDTRWEAAARELARERATLARAASPDPPPVPLWRRTELWLAGLVGGEQALAAVDADPLSDDADDLDLPTGGDGDDRARLEAAAEQLGDLAERWFGTEGAVACRRALVLTHRRDAFVTRSARSEAQLVGGVAWAVGKANGWLGSGRAHPSLSPTGVVLPLTMSTLQAACGLTSSPAALGQQVQRALLGLRTPAERPYQLGAPDLLPLGDALLLTSVVRARVVGWREAAYEARRTDGGEAVSA